MNEKGPQVVHVGATPATVEQVYFPGSRDHRRRRRQPAALAGRLEGKLPNAGALLGLREKSWQTRRSRSTEDRFPLTPQRIVHDVREVMPPDGIVTLDNGMYKIWFARNYRTSVANTLLLDNALATMGAGLPSAIAAALIHPERRVLAVCGDGGFMMNSQELETAVRLGAAPRGADPRGPRLRHDPLEAGSRSFRRFRPDLRQSGFRRLRQRPMARRARGWHPRRTSCRR
jgi:acetolactate synthase-1/2/3 large subunit